MKTRIKYPVLAFGIILSIFRLVFPIIGYKKVEMRNALSNLVQYLCVHKE
ncbi:MAG: hypothetical protein LBR26_12050 [Prevotella sp.]|jgi:hypothetical protein|nr:hypothetical protein [Prevotella sp.]